MTPLVIADWGLLDYQEALARQTVLVQRQLDGCGRDTLVMVEHPPTVTLGRRGSLVDLQCSPEVLSARGIGLQQINRGGLATAHEPGQLVVYPIVALKKQDLRWFSRQFLSVILAVLSEYGLDGSLRDNEPGIWVAGGKICSFGIALKRWICSHGIALNVNNDLATFETIIPCGRREERITSMARELGRELSMQQLRTRLVAQFAEAFDYEPVAALDD